MSNLTTWQKWVGASMAAVVLVGFGILIGQGSENRGADTVGVGTVSPELSGGDLQEDVRDTVSESISLVVTAEDLFKYERTLTDVEFGAKYHNQRFTITGTVVAINWFFSHYGMFLGPADPSVVCSENLNFRGTGLFCYRIDFYDDDAGLQTETDSTLSEIPIGSVQSFACNWDYLGALSLPNACTWQR